MINAVRELSRYRELIVILAWKSIAVRYKQAYLGIAWAVFRPVMLMLIFTLVRGFVGIESGDIPYPILTFAALMPWVFFQEATTEGINSVVANAVLVRKIYFPAGVIFPVTAVMTKLVELGINFVILSGLMAYYGMAPSLQICWVPLIMLYTISVSLVVSVLGAAGNVYYRDITSAFPVLISLLMYASPVIYPLSLVKKTLLLNRAAGEWSDILYNIYLLNPFAGIIDAFQQVVLHASAPDFSALLPGAVSVCLMLPVSWYLFRKAERHFADVV